MPKIRNILRGYRYTTSSVIKYGEYSELKKLAKRENRKLRRQRRVDRLAVYPVPGQMPGMGQLVIMR